MSVRAVKLVSANEKNGYSLEHRMIAMPLAGDNSNFRNAE